MKTTTPNFTGILSKERENDPQLIREYVDEAFELMRSGCAVKSSEEFENEVRSLMPWARGAVYPGFLKEYYSKRLYLYTVKAYAAMKGLDTSLYTLYGPADAYAHALSRYLHSEPMPKKVLSDGRWVYAYTNGILDRVFAEFSKSRVSREA